MEDFEGTVAGHNIRLGLILAPGKGFATGES